MQKDVAAAGHSPVPVNFSPQATAPVLEAPKESSEAPNNVVLLRNPVPTDLESAFEKWLDGVIT